LQRNHRVMQGAPSAYARSMYGGSRVTDKDDLHTAKPAAAPSTAPTQTAQKAAGQQAETAWSLLGKMYSSQVLAYMVAITDAQALIKRMRSMRPGKFTLYACCCECHITCKQICLPRCTLCGVCCEHADVNWVLCMQASRVLSEDIHEHSATFLHSFTYQCLSSG
jgi:hypothetical protein